MGVKDLSLSKEHYDRAGAFDGVLIDEGESSPDLRLVWSTEFGTDWQKEWLFQIAFSGYKKGMPYSYTGISLLSSKMGFSATIPASDCNPVKPDGDKGRVFWSHSLDIGGMMREIGSLEYASRKYDTFTITVSLKSNFNDGMSWNGSTSSDTAMATLSVGFRPKYTIVGAHYDDPGYLTVEYDTTWTRKDDRFWVCTKSESEGGICTVDGIPLMIEEHTGTIDAIGKIRIPTSKLRKHLAGDDIYLNIFFNAVYRPVGMYFNHAAGWARVQNRMVCGNVTVSVVSEGETIRIKTGYVDDGNTRPDYVSVKMDGGIYSFDTVNVYPGEIAEFKYPPFGKTVSFSAVGVLDFGGSSPMVATCTASTKAVDRCVIDAIGTGERLYLRMIPGNGSPGPTISASPEVETVKLAGRMRPCAYYGTGGTKSISFEGILLEEGGEEFERLADSGGDVLLRFPDGRRYSITPKIDVKRGSHILTSVSISGDEVGA